MGLRVSESWGAAGRERAARWLTGRAAPSVGCVRAVRVGLKRREGGAALGWPWAERGRERAVAGWAGPSGERERRVGRCWAASWVLGWVLGFLFFLLFSFLNLIQTKFEFKFEFEFKPHSKKKYAPA